MTNLDKVFKLNDKNFLRFMCKKSVYWGVIHFFMAYIPSQPNDNSRKDFDKYNSPIAIYLKCYIRISNTKLQQNY